MESETLYKCQHIRKLSSTWKRGKGKSRENKNTKRTVWIKLWYYFNSIRSTHVFAASIWQSREVISPHDLSRSSGDAHTGAGKFRNTHKRCWARSAVRWWSQEGREMVWRKIFSKSILIITSEAMTWSLLKMWTMTGISSAYVSTYKLVSGNVPQSWTEITYTSKLLKRFLSHFQPETTSLLPSCS